jgi:hypothetical protein
MSVVATGGSLYAFGQAGRRREVLVGEVLMSEVLMEEL